MADIIGYRCPVCGGELTFDSASQKMKCIYCENTFEMSQFEKKDEVLEEKVERKKDEWSFDELTGKYLYRCSHCSGEVVGDENLGATTCPFCDMPVVMVSQFSGDLKPKYIIPFKLKKDEAVKKLKSFCEGKKLLPKSFTQNNRVESIKGMYVPFWLFDCTIDVDGTYSGTKRKTWSDSSYDYVETSYYDVTRKGSITFDNVPVDGSVKLDNTYMESIEPYDYKEMVPFESAYMAGYIADRYDEDDENAKRIATDRMTTTATNMFKAEASKGYASCTQVDAKLSHKFTNRDYVLLPVWILSTNYNNKIYTYMMNGQTGKFIGKLPIDKGLEHKYFFSTWSLITLIGTALLSLIYLI